MIKILEIYNETRCIGNYFDLVPGFLSYPLNYQKLDPGNLNGLKDFKPDVVWLTPDCSTYSLAGISHHRRKAEDGQLVPISDKARYCDELNEKLIDLIKEINPKCYFIENPVGGLCKMNFMKDLPRYTITYCQYGDNRRKPTDIWTNHPNPKFKPVCHRGDPCHEAAPRGCTKSGTQRRRSKEERRRMPPELCNHIIELCKEITG